MKKTFNNTIARNIADAINKQYKSGFIQVANAVYKIYKGSLEKEQAEMVAKYLRPDLTGGNLSNMIKTMCNATIAETAYGVAMEFAPQVKHTNIRAQNLYLKILTANNKLEEDMDIKAMRTLCMGIVKDAKDKPETTKTVKTVAQQRKALADLLAEWEGYDLDAEFFTALKKAI